MGPPSRPTFGREGGSTHFWDSSQLRQPQSRVWRSCALGVDRDRGAHILHSFFLVPVGLYDPDRRLFGCRRELPPEGLLAITEILVSYFAELRAVITVSQEDHQVYLEGVPPSGWLTMPC